MDNEEILNYVYSNYPEYTVYDQIEKGSQKKGKGVVTIGYEGRTIDEFLSVMISNGVNVVIDVRKNPSSRKFGFNKTKLSDYLSRFKIQYVHIPELGIEASLRKNLESYEDYRELFKRYEAELINKEDILARIKKMSEQSRVALLCF